MQGAWVPCLVRELRSYKPHGAMPKKKKTQRRKCVVRVALLSLPWACKGFSEGILLPSNKFEEFLSDLGQAPMNQH